MDSFRNKCEAHAQRELEARSVSLVADGTHAILTASVSCMGFYDVKSAKLTNIFEGEGFLFTPRVL